MSIVHDDFKFADFSLLAIKLSSLHCLPGADVSWTYFSCKEVLKSRWLCSTALWIRGGLKELPCVRISRWS